MVNLPIEYSSKPVTPFIDMSLMKRFIDQTGIREKLDELDVPALGSNRGSTTPNIYAELFEIIYFPAVRH